ncbi:MAG: DnaJ domain-containing protein [Deltaproteobacteria bacterium]|nr:DnaJ domain-containing protein [Deltaproteobacteria bacterium]
MTDRDLYADLGVARDASVDDIRKAYRKLAREHHPDVNPNEPAAEERFKKVSFANSVLSDPDKRSRYDEFGLEGLADGFDPEQARAYQRWSQGARQSPHFENFSSEIDLEDLLAGFFGGAGASANVPTKGRDAESNLQIDFIDAVRGAKLPLHFANRTDLEVTIPAGVRDGARIRLAGQGEPGRNQGPSGDLYLNLSVSPHPFFERDGDDLLVTLPVTLPELVQGAAVSVPTPKGDVSMTIPAGSKNGQRLRLRHKGVAPSSGSASAGDLFVTLQLVLPEGHDEQMQILVKQFEELYEGKDVREQMIDMKKKK